MSKGKTGDASEKKEDKTEKPVEEKKEEKSAETKPAEKTPETKDTYDDDTKKIHAAFEAWKESTQRANDPWLTSTKEQQEYAKSIETMT